MLSHFLTTTEDYMCQLHEAVPTNYAYTVQMHIPSIVAFCDVHATQYMWCTVLWPLYSSLAWSLLLPPSSPPPILSSPHPLLSPSSPPPILSPPILSSPHPLLSPSSPPPILSSPHPLLPPSSSPPILSSPHPLFPPSSPLPFLLLLSSLPFLTLPSLPFFRRLFFPSPFTPSLLPTSHSSHVKRYFATGESVSAEERVRKDPGDTAAWLELAQKAVGRGKALSYLELGLQVNSTSEVLYRY